MQPPTPWRAALTLRWTVLRRRFVSPLEGVILGVVCGLAYAVGTQLAPRVATTAERTGSGLSLLLLLWVLAQTRLSRKLLYGAKELALLVPSGLAPTTLVRLRLLEATALSAVVLLPLLLCLCGVEVAQGRSPSPALAAAPLLWAPGLGALALIGGWLGGRIGGAFALGLVSLGAGAGALALWPDQGPAVLGHRLGPGGALVALVRGDLIGAFPAAVASTLLVVLADRLVATGFREGLDRAGRREVRKHRHLHRALGFLLRVLGQQAGALLRRDLVLFVRGGFPRGVLILSLLPLALAVVPILAGEKGTRPGHLSLAALLVCGIIGSASGFLFGVDFPRARRDQLLVERTQPVRARAVLISRWVPAACYAALVGLVCAGLIAHADRGVLAREALPILWRALALVAITSHHAVSYGLRTEARLDPSEAAAYPLNGGVVVILFAGGLTLHPLVALAYPLLWWSFSTQALRRWETAEVEAMHQAAA